MEVYKNRDFIDIQSILTQGKKSHPKPKIHNFYVNNKVNDMNEKEKDLELNKKLIECNFNINDAFNVIMSSNIADDSIIEKNQNKTVKKNPNKNNKKRKTEKNFNQADLMDLGILGGKIKIQRRMTMIRKESQKSIDNNESYDRNKNNEVNKRRKNSSIDYEANFKDTGNENMWNKFRKDVTTGNISNFQPRFQNSQKNFWRKDSNFSNKNNIHILNNDLKVNAAANLDSDRVKKKSNIESKRINNYKFKNSSNSNSRPSPNRNNNKEAYFNNENNEAKAILNISSNTNKNNFYNWNNFIKKNSLNISDRTFSSMNVRKLNLNNKRDTFTTNENYNKFLSNEKPQQEQEEETLKLTITKDEAENKTFSRLFRTAKINNEIYNSFRLRKTREEVSLKHDKNLRTDKKYDNLKEKYFSKNNSIRKDSIANEDLNNFFDCKKVIEIEIHEKNNNSNTINIKKNLNKTGGYFSTFNQNAKKSEAKLQSVTIPIKNIKKQFSSNSNIIFNREILKSTNNFSPTQSRKHKTQNESSREAIDERLKNNFSTNAKIKPNSLINNNNNIKIIENSEEYSSFINNNNVNINYNPKTQKEKKEQLKSFKRTKAQFDLRTEKKNKKGENLPQAFISRSEKRLSNIENQMKLELNMKENAEENTTKIKKDKKFNRYLCVEKPNEYSQGFDKNDLNTVASASSKKKTCTRDINNIYRKKPTLNRINNRYNNLVGDVNINYLRHNIFYNDNINNYKNQINSIDENQNENETQKNKTTSCKLNTKITINKKTDLMIDTGNLNSLKHNNLSINNDLFFNTANTNNHHLEKLRETLVTPQTQKSSSITSNVLLNSINRIETKTNKITKSLSKHVQKYQSVHELSAAKIDILQDKNYLTIIKKPKTSRPRIIMISSSVEEKRKNFTNLSENRRSLLKIGDFIETMNDKIALNFKSDIEREYKKSAMKNGLVDLNEILDKKYQKIMQNSDVLENISIKTKRLENSIFSTRNKIEKKYFTEEGRKNQKNKKN